MGKRFYIVLFCVFSLSVVLLGLSYSKESGVNNEVYLADNTNDTYRVIFDNDNLIDTGSNNTMTLSIINMKNEEFNYSIKLKELDDLKYKDVYYTINNGEEIKLKDDVIELGTLNSYGSLGDQGTYQILIYSKCNALYNFEVSLNNKKINTLNYVITLSEQTYIDSDGNNRYYGTSPNNYIKYNGVTYRIIGIVDGKVKVISEDKGLGIYDVTKGTYLTLNDYLKAFNNNDVTIDNVLKYDSWIENRGFWLMDTVGEQAYYASMSYGVGLSNKKVDYYIRYVYEIPQNSVVVAGDGSLNSPYEVTYGS